MWIRDRADAYHLPVTTHNCGSPVMTMVVAHLMISCPNANGIETVRSLYKTFDITDNGVDIRNGHIYLSDRPGLGINLKDEVYNCLLYTSERIYAAAFCRLKKYVMP